jgi:hypothetical protein
MAKVKKTLAQRLMLMSKRHIWKISEADRELLMNAAISLDGMHKIYDEMSLRHEIQEKASVRFARLEAAVSKIRSEEDIRSAIKKGVMAALWSADGPVPRFGQIEDRFDRLHDDWVELLKILNKKNKRKRSNGKKKR